MKGVALKYGVEPPAARGVGWAFAALLIIIACTLGVVIHPDAPLACAVIGVVISGISLALCAQQFVHWQYYTAPLSATMAILLAFTGLITASANLYRQL